MNARLQAYKPLLWLLAIVLGGVALVSAVRHGGPDDTGAATKAEPVPATPAVAAPAAVATMADESLPPWMSPTRGTAAATAVSRQQLAPTGPQPTRAELVQALAHIRSKAEQNDRAANELLRQIDTLEASGKLPANLDAQALRTNLYIAKRSQALTRELAELAVAEPGTETRPRMDAIVAELQQLQKQLRYDVSAGLLAPAAVPAQAAAPAQGTQ